MQGFTFIMTSALAPALLASTYSVQDAKGAIENGWSRVAYQEDRDCRIEVTGSGNGKFYRITVKGLQPGETGRFHLTNENIKPISYDFKSDGKGSFSKIYLPFLWHHRGGTVSVNVEGEQCQVSVAFPWKRIPADQTRYFD